MEGYQDKLVSEQWEEKNPDVYKIILCSLSAKCYKTDKTQLSKCGCIMTLNILQKQIKYFVCKKKIDGAFFSGA